METNPSYTDPLQSLPFKIEAKTAVLAVIGLGYVGLPVASMFSAKGFRVFGLDLKADRIDLINEGKNPIEGNEPGLAELLNQVVKSGKLVATTNYGVLSQADIILVDVETPTDDQHIPRYQALRGACESLGEYAKPGALVIIESTIAPGTISGTVKPVLAEAASKRNITSFYIGACPERVMPGKLLANLRSMSRVCGGETPEIAEVMVQLYRQIVEADLDTASVITAELTKTAENAYRDVNIAFANELAMICEAAGGDFLEVRRLVNKPPGRNLLLAGAGVGGHCIPKDPWLLAYGAKGKFDPIIIPAARAINDGMPIFIADKACLLLEKNEVPIKNSTVAVLGYAYLEDSDDARNSPTETLVSTLSPLVGELRIHDPYIQPYQTDVYETLKGADILIVMVAHSMYKTLNLDKVEHLMRHHILLDGRRVIDSSQATQSGLQYHAIGLGLSLTSRTE
jgi:UDP-N-acetyl-D-mannosaminuronic acid dehydrogenase